MLNCKNTKTQTTFGQVLPANLASIFVDKFSGKGLNWFSHYQSIITQILHSVRMKVVATQ